MNPERWRELSPHLDRALDLEGEARAQYLATLRAEDPALADDLAAMLDEAAAVDKAGFLESGRPAHPDPTLVGQKVGSYTLMELLGHGGMGSVWRARRSDGRFEGLAAVKLLNANLRGGAGEERFRQEGRILARLTHPHIAHLLDAGVSSFGPPYLVLELVEGEPIDAYCERLGLDVPARVRLFLDVLDAVAYAHTKLVVHRDIKPSNVLVSSTGEVKLLDFGIAKLLAGADGSEVSLTRTTERALTPQYAAPEQLTGGEITTATDVYALGGLLYLLLCGRHPASGARAPAELVRAIVGVDTPRASEAATDPQARRLLRGDLDIVVGKALNKEPAARYASVAAFADDLRRTLRHEPIAAHPDALSYRAARFVRRHRAAVGLAALTLLALVAGLIGTVTQARRARTERDFAIAQLARAEDLNELNNFLLSDAAPGGRAFTVGELLERAEHLVIAEPGPADAARVETLIGLGRQFWSQDRDADALRVLTKAYAWAAVLPEPAVRAEAACALASAYSEAARFDRAESLYAEGLAQLPDSPQYALHRVTCLLRGSEVARENGEGATAVARAEQARELLRRSGQGSSIFELRVDMDLAESYRKAQRFREANDAFARASERLDALGRGSTQTAGTLLNNWGLVARSLGRVREAEEIFQKAVRISSADSGNAGVSPMLLNNLARVLGELHRFSEARQLAEDAYSRASKAGESLVVNQSLLVRSSTYRQLGELDRAARALDEFAERTQGAYPPGHPALIVLASERALLAEARGDAPEALAGQTRAVEMAEASAGAADYVPMLLLRRAKLELAGGRADAARATSTRALELERKIAGPGALSARIGRALLSQGRALRALGDPAARQTFAEALTHLEPSLGAQHPDTVEARQGAAPPS